MAHQFPYGFAAAMAVGIASSGAQVTLANPENMWIWQGVTWLSFTAAALFGGRGAWIWWREAHEKESDVGRIAWRIIPATLVVLLGLSLWLFLDLDAMRLWVKIAFGVGLLGLFVGAVGYVFTAPPRTASPSSDTLPIAISEVRFQAFANYAGFFRGNDPQDDQRISYGEVTIANTSNDRRVALDLTLKIAGGDGTKLSTPADLRGLAGLVYGKDDVVTKTLAGRGMELPKFHRNPIELGPQEVSRRGLVFLFSFGGDNELRTAFTRLMTRNQDYKFTLEVMDHISGKSISFTIPGSYRQKP